MLKITATLDKKEILRIIIQSNSKSRKAKNWKWKMLSDLTKVDLRPYFTLSPVEIAFYTKDRHHNR